MNLIFKKTIIGVFIATGLLMSASAFAIDYVSLTTIPGVSTKGQVLKNPAELVTGVYNTAIGIGAILAVIMIIIAGMKYTTSEAMGTKTMAKQQIQDALIGLILLLGSFLILKTINKDLVNLAITLPVGEGNNLSELQVQRDQAINTLAQTNKAYQEGLAKEKTLRDQLTSMGKQKLDLQNKIDSAKNGGVISATELSSLQTQLDNLNGLYATTEKQAAAIKNSTELAKINGLIKVNTERAAYATSNPNDPQIGGAELATAALKRNEVLYQQKIDLLTSSGAPQSQINSAISEKNIAVASIQQNTLTQAALTEATVAGKLVDFPKTLELRNTMVSETNKIIAELKKTEPDAAAALTQKTLADIKKINAAAELRANCKATGETFNSSSYECTK